MASRALTTGHAVVRISPAAVLRWTLGVAVVLFAADAALSIADGVGAAPHGLIVTELDGSREANIPTWYSSLLLAGCGLAAAMVASTAARWARHWALVGVALFAASMDEVSQLHERVPGPLRQGLRDLGLSGTASRVAAVALVAGALLALLLAYLPWLRSLPRATRAGLLAAATIYVGSAFGLEVVNRLSGRLGIDTDFITGMLSAVEELGEKVGASLALCTLLALLLAYGTPEPALTAVPADPAAA